MTGSVEMSGAEKEKKRTRHVTQPKGTVQYVVSLLYSLTFRRWLLDLLVPGSADQSGIDAGK